MNRIPKALAVLVLATLTSTPLACRNQPAEIEDEYPSWPTKVPEGKIEFKKSLGKRQVVADFSGGHLSSDGGALLLREVERLQISAPDKKASPEGEAFRFKQEFAYYIRRRLRWRKFSTRACPTG